MGNANLKRQKSNILYLTVLYLNDKKNKKNKYTNLSRVSICSIKRKKEKRGQSSALS